MANFPTLQDVHWVSIEEILNSWLSIDSKALKTSTDISKELTYKEWEILLTRKREECEYEEIRPIIEQEGFRMPLVYEIQDRTGKFCHCQGNHRLACAIDLGYKYLPYVHYQWADGGCWHIADFEWDTLIHPENPLPTNPILTDK